MSNILAGKVVSVAGGAGGICQATCRILASTGASVVVADIAEAAGNATVETVKWLISDAASFVTDAAIAVDGGYLAI